MEIFYFISTWCAFTFLMSQDNFFYLIPKLNFWKVPKMKLELAHFFSGAMTNFKTFELNITQPFAMLNEIFNSANEIHKFESIIKETLKPIK